VLFSTTTVTPPLEVYDAADAVSDKLLREHPQGFFQLILAKHGLPMPSQERRARIARSMSRLDGKILGIAMVFDGGGLWSSSMRMVANAMMMVIPSRCPRRMFGDLPAAIGWLQQSFPAAGLAAHTAQLNRLDTLLEGCPARCPCAKAGPGQARPHT
jgi:hypothetical protein